MPFAVDGILGDTDVAARRKAKVIRNALGDAIADGIANGSVSHAQIRSAFTALTAGQKAAFAFQWAMADIVLDGYRGTPDDGQSP